VCCAAGLASFEVLLEEGIVEEVHRKAVLFRELLVHPSIKCVSNAGLLMAVSLESPEKAVQAVQECLKAGLFTDWFLFAPYCLRIAPPLTISEDEIREAAVLLKQALTNAG
jgi:acetylornithine/succinyldiaminopimelate/putrescine aminotransferase